MSRLKFPLELLFVLLLLPTKTLNAQNVENSSRVILNFNNDWRFLKDDTNGAEYPSFDDSSWRKLDVPHDWSIEGPYDMDNPTSQRGKKVTAHLNTNYFNLIISSLVLKNY
jgi:beta-galactosidase